MLEVNAVVKVEEGLHTRPATQFAKMAKGFDCEVEVVRNGRTANGKSAVKLMLLGVQQNETILLRTVGADEAQASEVLQKFLSDEDAIRVEKPEAGAGSTGGEGELRKTSIPAEPAIPGAFKGIAASEGHRVASGFVYVREAIVAPSSTVKAGQEVKEWQRFETIFHAVCSQLKGELNGTPEDSAIVEALLDVSADEEFIGAIRTRILAGSEATAACLAVGEDLAYSFEHMPDAYMQARAEDIRGLTRQLALKLLGKEDLSLSELSTPCIVVAEDLSALDFAKANLDMIQGIICMRGSATSHVAIMARANGIPAILGLSQPLSADQKFETIAMSGTSGHVWFNPSYEVIEHCKAKQFEEEAQYKELEAYRDYEPVTKAGRRIEVAANLGTLREIKAAKEAGAMGCGLFRTELLFMDRRSMPDEDEQAVVYGELAKAFGDHPVIIRTLDIGGDKPLSGIDFPEEENPFLGWRGLRMCLDRPDIFRPQLRALLRAAVHGNVKVMFPMVSDGEEIRRAKQMMYACAAELKAEGVAHGDPEVGIMIETPAAALTAPALAQMVDFFSIGTNDLTQYVMAADRLNPKLNHLYQTDHPAVMEAIRLVCKAANEAEIMVGICGEAASKPELIPQFVAMGVDELSMSPSAILRAKKIISEL
ncbi:phosphoenolpyruvate--protein phosphotransferase [Rhodobacteraceae bacterium RKSG542]|uniref:phosphoenolpyruvate--protein phosphotransferase n=1 Tax=Pseudovibrio flavus TaxID=2529854 RepID=UPI0012BC1624|nr:phosphoenolpyruvate--protein phosphotransferase [Pseudovibrio flavus]MTI18057.1 phosphoenolpyruvate--protein phosphotransferase [Pseudovibrio flavus]